MPTVAYVNETINKPNVSISVVDINDKTISLTGDNKKIVKGYSNAQVSWSASSKNSATLKSTKINDVLVSSSPILFNNATTNIFKLNAIDSREISNSISTNSTTNPLIEYIPLTVDVVFKRIGATTGKVGVEFSGNYFNQSFGNITNTLSLEWKYRVKGTNDWINGGIFVKETDYRISDNKFTSLNTITLNGDFDYKNIYEFGLFYQDKIINTYVVKTVPKGQPVYWWNKNGLNINGQLNLSNKYGDFDLSSCNWGNNVSLNDYEGDLNNLVTSGWYPVNSGNTNIPENGSFMILVMCKNPSYYVKQVAFSRENHSIYQRFKISPSSWSNWELVNTNKIPFYQGMMRRLNLFGNIHASDSDSSNNWLSIRTPASPVNATMYRIKIQGYIYGKQSPLDLEIVWYYYSTQGRVINSGWYGIGPSDVRIAEHTDGTGKFFWISLNIKNCYFSQFWISEFDTNNNTVIDNSVWYSMTSSALPSYTGNVYTIPEIHKKNTFLEFTPAINTIKTTAQSWSNLAFDTSINIAESGLYLLSCRIGVGYAGATGWGTLRVMIDGEEIQSNSVNARTTIPICNQTAHGILTIPVRLSAGNHIFNAQIYGDYSVSSIYCSFTLIKQI